MEGDDREKGEEERGEGEWKVKREERKRGEKSGRRTGEERK